MVEQTHRHTIESGLGLLATSHLSKICWPDAFSTIVYLINRLPTPTLHFTSPYKKLLNKDHAYQSLKVFVCACFLFFDPTINTNWNLGPNSAFFLAIRPIIMVTVVLNQALIGCFSLDMWFLMSNVFKQKVMSHSTLSLANIFHQVLSPSPFKIIFPLFLFLTYFH